MVNQINISSYISTFTTLTLLMGLVFQIPVLSFFLAKMGMLSAGFMKRYRRHAFVVIVATAAIITPPDIFTCCMVTIPMYGLYELSILIVGRVGESSLKFWGRVKSGGGKGKEESFLLPCHSGGLPGNNRIKNVVEIANQVKRKINQSEQLSFRSLHLVHGVWLGPYTDGNVGFGVVHE